MYTMKKLLVFTMFIAIAICGAYATVSQNNKEVIGEWKYEVPTAPYGYQKGVLVINEKEGNLVGEVKFEDGYKVELKNLKYSEGTFQCGLYIDYDYISVKTAIKEKVMIGVVNSPDGELKITAERVK